MFGEGGRGLRPAVRLSFELPPFVAVSSGRRAGGCRGCAPLHHRRRTGAHPTAPAAPTADRLSDSGFSLPPQGLSPHSAPAPLRPRTLRTLHLFLDAQPGRIHGPTPLG